MFNSLGKNHMLVRPHFVLSAVMGWYQDRPLARICITDGKLQ